LKARLHRGGADRKVIKSKFGHNIAKAYRNIDKSEQILSTEEEKVLATAGAIYDKRKGFDYPEAWDGIQAYGDFPQLSDLAGVARKLIG
jgi:hypothetical protein